MQFGDVHQHSIKKLQLTGAAPLSHFYFLEILNLGEGVSNKKTNGVGKDDVFGCKWAALSALITFQESAKRQGANAVVNLVSYYKKNQTESSTTVQCHAGVFVIGVTLKGTYAKVAQ